MGVDERGINESSLLLYWWIPIPEKVQLEFMPSISKFGTNSFINQTWINQSEYLFTSLQPFTKYNMTVYVRLKESKTIFPPARYFISRTGEGNSVIHLKQENNKQYVLGIPSEPWNVTVHQRNGSHVLISWNKPEHPNGVIQNYEICWYPPLPPIKLKLSDNSTAHLLAADFQPNINYSFYVSRYFNWFSCKLNNIVSAHYT